jgi:S-adenosylmethionine:tRNA ribosyltransferase-isomerase
MRTEEFDYPLPQHLIAQHPLPERHQSRLMVVDRGRQAIEHAKFSDLPALLASHDLLVFNNTRVVKARLYGHRRSTGGRWEGLFLAETSRGTWQILSQARGNLRPGEIIDIAPGFLHLELLQKTGNQWTVRAHSSEGPDWTALLERFGHVPLPPYIRKGRDEPADAERYQTIFAEHSGSVAAPTAGLHFSPSVLGALQARDIRKTFVTLHVGAGTFLPIATGDIEEHVMHPEWGEVSEETAKDIQACQAAGHRVVAVGTTTVRLLESAASAEGTVQPYRGMTQLYIHPPYDFRAADALITNFHLPRSSLLVLVSAFTGVDLIRRAYMTAIDEQYRFYSYGDAMLIL